MVTKLPLPDNNGGHQRTLAIAAVWPVWAISCCAGMTTATHRRPGRSRPGPRRAFWAPHRVGVARGVAAAHTFTAGRF